MMSKAFWNLRFCLFGISENYLPPAWRYTETFWTQRLYLIGRKSDKLDSGPRRCTETLWNMRFHLFSQGDRLDAAARGEATNIYIYIYIYVCVDTCLLVETYWNILADKYNVFFVLPSIVTTYLPQCMLPIIQNLKTKVPIQDHILVCRATLYMNRSWTEKQQRQTFRLQKTIVVATALNHFYTALDQQTRNC